MADQLPLFPFTSQEDWYGELVFTSADDGSALSLAGRTFEMPVTPAIAGFGGAPVNPVVTLTMATGGGLSLKAGTTNTLVFRVPRTTAQAFDRTEYTADVLEVVDGERHVFMPVRVAYSDPSGLRSFSSRNVGVAVSFAARVQPIVTPVAIAGRQGAQGATIITGLVPPVPADGRDGDYWIEDRTASNRGRRMYGPKAGGAWPGTPYTIQVAAYADVPGLSDALAARIPISGGTTQIDTPLTLIDGTGGTIASRYGSGPAPRVQSPGSGNAAALSFGIPGVIDAWIGFDTDGKFKRGGGSKRGSAFTVWDEENFNPTGDNSGSQVKVDPDAVLRRLDVIVAGLGFRPSAYRTVLDVDDTFSINTAIRKAAAAGGGTVWIEKLRNSINDTLALNFAGCNGVTLMGPNHQVCVIESSALDRPAIRLGGIGNRVCNLQVAFKGAVSAGSGAIGILVENSAAAVLDHLQIYNTDGGIKVLRGGGILMHDLSIGQHKTFGLFFDTVIDAFLCNFIINAGDLAGAALGNLVIKNGCEAIVVTNGDILLGQYSLSMDADSFAIGLRPAYCRLTAVYFDSAVNGSKIRRTVELGVVNCWFSGGHNDNTPSSSQPGCTLIQCSAIRFVSTAFFNCGSHGLLVAGDCVYIILSACVIESNSMTAGFAVAHGVLFLDGATKFTVINCVGSNSLYNGKQNFCVVIASGCTRFNVSNNIFDGAGGRVADYSNDNGATSLIAANL